MNQETLQPAPRLSKSRQSHLFGAGLTKLPWHRQTSLLGTLFVLLALLAAYLLRPPSNPPYVAQYVPVTASGRSKIGALLPQERDLYFLELVGGHQVLASVPVGGGEVSLLRTSLDNLQLADISPQGNELLVGTRLGTQAEWPLWRISLTAGMPASRLGSVLGHGGAWSPDGRMIAYGRGNDLYVMNNDGSQSRLLVSLPGVARWIRWSPDGRLIRFTVLHPQNRTTALWEVSSNGRNLHPLLPQWNDPPWECCGNWTPDGTFYVFQSTRESNSHVWALRDKEQTWRRNDRLPVQLTRGPISYRAPAISRDGKRIFVVGDQRRSELLRYESGSQRFEPYLGGISAESLDFSRDSQWVAYVSYPDGALWRCKVDGSERRRLSPLSMHVYLPRWSPDGTQLTFRAEVAAKPVKIYTISAGGQNLTQLFSDDRGEADPGWSPDGKKLVFGRLTLPYDPRPRAIHIYDLERKHLTTVSGSEGMFSPRWSPDGRYIAALSLDSQRLMLFDVNREEWQELARINASYPSWAADSSALYFGARVNNNQGQYRVSLGDRRVERLVSLPDALQEGTSFALWSGIAPDSSIIVARDLSSQEIYGLEWQIP
jgi:Tol biopolymer transport system component